MLVPGGSLLSVLARLLFGGLGLIPSGARPSRGEVFGSIELDYKLALNLVTLGVFATLFGLTMRRSATDPVCGMKVDRAKALTAEHAGRTYFFCSEHCRHAFEADPDRYTGATASPHAEHAPAHSHSAAGSP